MTHENFKPSLCCEKEMIKLVYFGFNFGYKFIEECWQDEKLLAEHLRKKFDCFVKRENSVGGFFRFFVELDRGNQHKLCAYISNTFKD